MVEPNEVGAKINQLRREKGLTQEQLGDKLNVSAQAVSKWENGDSLPDISIITDVARELGCTADFLLGSEGTLNDKLPQIIEELSGMGDKERIDFLGQMIDAISKPKADIPFRHAREKNELPFVHLGPDGLHIWAKRKFILLSTSEFLEEVKAGVQGQERFPLNIIDADQLDVLLAVMTRKAWTGPGFALTETELKEALPQTINFDQAINNCIESGFMEKGKGGYKLNIKAEIAVWLFMVTHRVVSKPGTISASYENADVR